MSPATLTIREFSDPACPFAFSAEPGRWRLRWLFGEQIDWQPRMVVLSESPEQSAKSGLTLELQAQGMLFLSQRYGMPIDTSPRPRLTATADACRAFIAAKLYAPERSTALLRRLRIRIMAGYLLDEPEQIAIAASEAGVDQSIVTRALSADPDVEAELRRDMAAARSPSPAAEALDHKLAAAGEGRRYTCPSYEIERHDSAARFDAPGFQPVDVYEVGIANLAPELERRPAPESVEEVLAWAGEPLATVEVAAVCGLDVGEARSELTRVASFDPVGSDGWWSALREPNRAAA